MARKILSIVEHCSAAKPSAAAKQTAEIIDAMHRRDRGWRKIGYHYFIRTDGTTEKGREEAEIGAGVFGFNKYAIHVCYAGGLDLLGKPADTRTDAQKAALNELRTYLFEKYAEAKGKGHRDFSPDLDGDGIIEPHEWLKECPCYDVAADLKANGFGARAIR